MPVEYHFWVSCDINTQKDLLQSYLHLVFDPYIIQHFNFHGGILHMCVFTYTFKKYILIHIFYLYKCK